jgi:hypothetical protein
MSVTFRPELVDNDMRGWGFECYPSGMTFAYDTKDEAEEAAFQHGCTCRCGEYRIFVSPVYQETPEVNMANGNAAFILSLLGFEFEDGFGTSDAAEFAERIKFALVVGGDDKGSETVEYQTEGGARVVFCGRHVGYADERLDQLAEIAEWAIANNRRVVWS